jgi:hypothetical protein
MNDKKLLHIINDISGKHCTACIFSHLPCDEEPCNKELHKAIERIEALPTAESQRKAGKWEVLYPSHKYKYHCSECGANHSAMYDFCPSCGARMDGESE